MISYLKGKIINKRQGFIIVETNNIGYKIFVCPALYIDFEENKEIEVYIYQYVREDSLDLYGFKNIEELELFEQLLSISGIGPKSALGVLGIALVDEIKESISRGDPALLTKVSGIGRKTAERVVLELRGKIDQSVGKGIKTNVRGSASGDEIDALMALGYSLSQAREALWGVDTEIKDSGERIRRALKRLSK